jgi:hypothetical protein
MDVVAMRGLDRILPGNYHHSRRLHRLALAGDLVANSLFYAAIPAPSRGATWWRAALFGTAAGVGALLLPQRIGLGTPPYSHDRANQFMTVAWYVVGAVAAAMTANMLADPISEGATENSNS